MLPLTLFSASEAQSRTGALASVRDVSAAIGSDTLFAASLLLAALSLWAVAGVIRARRDARRLARAARREGRALHDLLQTMRTAEDMAGIGVWQYDHGTRLQHWSEGMKRLFGIDPDAELVAGDAETLLYVNAVDLVGKVGERVAEAGPFAFRFDIHRFDGTPRTIAIEACNLRDPQGGVIRVVAVARDVTDTAEAGLENDGRSGCRSDSLSVPGDINRTRRPCLGSDIDPLTGLANRRRLMNELDRLVLDARLTLRPLVLVMFDIDHFRRVNQLHGHAEGDKVLEQVARIVEGEARPQDLVGRIGGEEFAWIIPNVTDRMAHVMTERLRQAIARNSGVDKVAPVTISLGFAGVHSGDTTLSLFARADRALYEAKHAGRNRVRVAA